MNVKKPEKITILGMGWVGLPLGKVLAHAGYQVKGSTTRVEKLSSIQEVGAEGYVIQVEDEVKGERLAMFFDCDILVLTMPPSSISPGGRRSRAEPDGRFEAAISSILAHLPAHAKVLYTSSTSVYGEVQGEVFEKDEPQPVTTSAKMVLQAERLIHGRQEFKGSIVRLGGLVGKNRNPARYLAGRKGLKNKEAAVNLIHLDDVVSVLERIIALEAWGEVFNLVADKHPTRAEYYSRRAELLGLELPSFESVGATSSKIVSNKKVREHLGINLAYPDPLQFPV